MNQEMESDLIQDNPPSPASPILPAEGTQVAPTWVPFTKVYPHRRCPAGILININDQFQFDSISKYGEYSDGEVRLWEDMLLPTDCVVEVGGNMGVHTVPLALMSSEVLTFEPQRLMYQILTANVALNSLHNVHTMNAAVGSSRGVLKVPVLDPYRFQSYGSFELRPDYTQGDDVVMLTLDSLNLQKVDFIKLDCEGAEMGVLIGARQLIEKLRPFIYLEYTSRRKEIRMFMKAMGYECYRHLPEHIDSTQLREGDLNYASDMLLCLPAERKPRPKMLMGFGEKHKIILADEEEILGHAKEVIIVEPYGKLDAEFATTDS